jgi:hypothetical protein
MSEKPILFSGAMVRAILDGRKTLTRRIIKFVNGFVPKEVIEFKPDCLGKPTWVFAGTINGDPAEEWVSPRYQSRDILCVKETWAETCDEYGSPIIVYRADNAAFYIGENQILAPCEAAWSLDNYPAHGKWRPSIFLPKWAWRIKQPVLSVRPERLQDITEDDIMEEGVTLLPQHINLVHSFWTLWDSINGKTHPWAANDWVWRYEFRRRENPKHV